jgi:hypothetical protein
MTQQIEYDDDKIMRGKTCTNCTQFLKADNIDKEKFKGKCKLDENMIKNDLGFPQFKRIITPFLGARECDYYGK